MRALLYGHAQARDIIALTLFFESQINATLGPDPTGPDRAFREHLVFVFNQAIQNLRKTGWSEKTLKKVGRLLFRLYKVFRAYQEKKKRYTMEGWLSKLSQVGADIDKTFS